MIEVILCMITVATTRYVEAKDVNDSSLKDNDIRNKIIRIFI